MADLVARAFKYLPGGSSWMWTLPPDLAFVVARGEGSRVWDTEGRAYLDYVLGSGPLLLGHAPPTIVAAVQAQAARGSTYQWLSEPTIRLAERLCEAVPCAQKVRFVSTGTEATMFAIRMARAFTGREKIVKFEGGWHGLHDYAMTGNWAWSEAPFPTARPDVGGVPKGALESVLVAPFNDLATIEEIFGVHGPDVAAILVEPLQRALSPVPGFLSGLRQLADRHGCLLIFDEVVTGFRLAWGGAQERYGVTPDLATYGKALTCGYSLAAVCGRSDIMDTADPSRKGTLDYALLSGTLSGNPLACAAGLAALDALSKPGTYPRLTELGRALRTGMQNVAARRGVGLQVLGDGPIAQPVFLDPSVRITTERDLRRADAKRAGRLGLELIRRGIFVIPGAKMYISLAHSDADLDRTLEAFGAALEACASSG